MKSIINKKLIVAFFVLFSTTIPYIVFAEDEQPAETVETTEEEEPQDANDVDSYDPPPPPDEEDPDAPIDGGVGILIATGIGYGIKKIYRSGKKQTQDK